MKMKYFHVIAATSCLNGSIVAVGSERRSHVSKHEWTFAASQAPHICTDIF